MTYTLLKGSQQVETEYRLSAICYNLLRAIHILGAEKLRKLLSAFLITCYAFLQAIWKLNRSRYVFYSLT